MTGFSALAAFGLKKGEIGAIFRFGLVGVVATLTYLGLSLLLLDRGLLPQLVNLIAFLASIATSYLGHYFFTYRASGSHARLSSRFVTVTIALSLLCSLLHQVVLWIGASAQLSALVVAVVYPLLSFLLNHFWAFSRGDTQAPAEAETLARAAPYDVEVV
jgi:putative flippase GtrA